MHDELIAQMQARVAHLQSVLKVCHDKRVVEIIRVVIESAEADIRKLQSSGETQHQDPTLK